MARNPFWLRGARGKFAGAVLQKGLDGNTIIRENVKPVDRKTVPQLVQRIVFATVNMAVSRMSKLVDHSFEGYDNERLSRQHFVKINVDALRAKAIEDYKNRNEGEKASAFLASKGNSSLIPNEYIISEGSLASPALNGFQDEDKAGSWVLPTLGGSWAIGSSPISDFLDLFFDSPGCELSHHGIYLRKPHDSYVIVSYDAQFGKEQMAAKYEGYRIVSRSDFDWSQPLFPSGVSYTNVAQVRARLKDVFQSAVVAAKSSSIMMMWVNNVIDSLYFNDIDAQSTSFDWTTFKNSNGVKTFGAFYTSLEPTSGPHLECCGETLMMSDPVSSKRSNEKILLYPVANAMGEYALWYGLDIFAALASFENTSLDEIYARWLDTGGYQNAI